MLRREEGEVEEDKESGETATKKKRRQEKEKSATGRSEEAKTEKIKADKTADRDNNEIQEKMVKQTLEKVKNISVNKR